MEVLGQLEIEHPTGADRDIGEAREIDVEESEREEGEDQRLDWPGPTLRVDPRQWHTEHVSRERRLNVAADDVDLEHAQADTPDAHHPAARIGIAGERGVVELLRCINRARREGRIEQRRCQNLTKWQRVELEPLLDRGVQLERVERHAQRGEVREDDAPRRPTREGDQVANWRKRVDHQRQGDEPREPSVLRIAARQPVQQPCQQHRADRHEQRGGVVDVEQGSRRDEQHRSPTLDPGRGQEPVREACCDRCQQQDLEAC